VKEEGTKKKIENNNKIQILKIGYTFIGNHSIAQNASVTTRYSETSYIEFLLDLYVLVNSDYLVCTFSSNFGRQAYQMRHQLFVDAADRTRSLDTSWHYSGHDNHQQVRSLEVP
jgi:hypothetical protein